MEVRLGQSLSLFFCCFPKKSSAIGGWEEHKLTKVGLALVVIRRKLVEDRDR